ncbi:cysteine hydrolase [Pseudomonas syringae]|uniref:Cysteine hydrolase n=1 Tax=Pseudomonas syringae TaxID=317 RepID=A0A1C7YZN1_PSESX|nr:isochorismatase family cysteine hydrolase [Pseudomonas syringae]OCR23121.1 cysteine hydrolase [Pseudomonas syringae]
MYVTKEKKNNPIIVGNPVLLVIDIQKGCFLERSTPSTLEFMEGDRDNYQRARTVIDAARQRNIPVIFIQEIHRKNLIDYGRELDGDENIHCLDGQPGTPLAVEEMGIREDDYIIQKRRYSAFYGSELEILLRGLNAQTLLMVGGFTDVCIHYTFVDGHQGDYHCRVAVDCVAGSSQAAHDASLIAMEYLQHGALRTSPELIAAMQAH